MKWKSSLVALVVLVIAASVLPAAFARDDDRSTRFGDDDPRAAVGVNASVANNNSGGQVTGIARAEERREVNDERKELLDDRKESREERRDALKNLREVGKERVEDAKQRIKEDRDRVKELRDEYKDRRDDLVIAQGKLRDFCMGNANSAQCLAARKEHKNATSQFLGNSVEQMLRIINETRTRVDVDSHIGNETAARVMAQLDARAAAISADNLRIDTLLNASNGTTNNATKAAAEQLRKDWMQARVTIRLAEGLLDHARFQEFLDRLTITESHLQNASSQLKAQGKNTTQLDADIASFGAKIDNATAAYVSARDSYVTAMQNATTEASANALLKSTRDRLQSTFGGLKAARSDLRNVIADIRALDNGVLRDIAAKINADMGEGLGLGDDE